MNRVFSATSLFEMCHECHSIALTVSRSEEGCSRSYWRRRERIKLVRGRETLLCHCNDSDVSAAEPAYALSSPVLLAPHGLNFRCLPVPRHVSSSPAAIPNGYTTVSASRTGTLHGNTLVYSPRPLGATVAWNKHPLLWQVFVLRR